MSDLKVLVESITVSEHPNADALELAHIDDYVSCIRKGEFKSGDLVAYIPEQAVVPDGILRELGLTGKLAGPQKNRVKAISLRGVLSQGICYPAKSNWVVNQDVTEELGITKYSPTIPIQMAGEVEFVGFGKCMKYDIENIKRYPSIIEEGEEVVFTEKIHGTWCQLCIMPDKSLIVSSKGQAAKGLAFKKDVKNIYTKNAARMVKSLIDYEHQYPFFVLFEIFGKGVQDLHYGDTTQQLLRRVFDVYVGTPGQGEYFSDSQLHYFCEDNNLPRVPVLYKGPFSREVLEHYTMGKETISGKEAHMREGIVITPVEERRHPAIGRVKLKSINPDYLFRQNGTEFN